MGFRLSILASKGRAYLYRNVNNILSIHAPYGCQDTLTPDSRFENSIVIHCSAITRLVRGMDSLLDDSVFDAGEGSDFAPPAVSTIHHTLKSELTLLISSLNRRRPLHQNVVGN